MNIWNFVVLAIVVLIVGASVFNMVRRRKRGKGGCSCGCSSCMCDCSRKNDG